MAVASLRQIKNRIRTVESVKKVMHAMEVVSSTKMAVLEKRVPPAKRYFSGLEGMMMSLMADSGDFVHPLTEEKKAKGRTAVFVLGSDMGLCGSYNTNLMRHADEFIKKAGGDVFLAAIGKKAHNHFKKKGMTPAKVYEGMRGRLPGDAPDKVLKDMEAMFLSGEVREVHLVYMHVESVGRQTPVTKKVLPLEKRAASGSEHIYEPDAESVLTRIIPAYLAAELRLAFLEGYAAENSMRAIAMKEATSNAKDLLEALTLTRNKVRQASITNELSEIVSSAEVMR